MKNGHWLDMQRLPNPAPQVALFLVTYWSDGLKVKGYLAQPDRRGVWPGLVYCRGGIGRVGMVRIPHIAALAQRGYVLFAPFYRGQSSGAGRDEFGGADRFDVYYAVDLLRSLPQTADVPVPVVGFSRGGIMAMLAAKECAGIGPVVVWSGVTDLLLTYEERVDLRRMLRRVVGHPVKQRDFYVERSSVHWAGQIVPPVLFVHGTDDTNVSMEHARSMARALEAENKRYAMALYDGLGHEFPDERLAEAADHMDNWIRKELARDGIRL